MASKTDTLKTLFPDFDIGGALANLADNASLLYKVMKSFYAQYNGAALAEMKSLLDAGKLDDAGRLAHTLKGLAGSIGTKDLQEACLALELACKEEMPPEKMQEIFEKFSASLTVTLDKIGKGLEAIPSLDAFPDT